MLIFLSFIVILSSYAAKNSTLKEDDTPACNSIDRWTVFKDEFKADEANGLKAQEPFNFLCYVPEPDCTSFMIAHKSKGSLFITSAHCLDGRNAALEQATIVVCPVYGHHTLAQQNFIYHPDYLKLKRHDPPLYSHDYDLAAFWSFSFDEKPIGFKIESPDLRIAKMGVMGFTKDTREDIQIANISNVQYIERHLEFHTSAKWGDCIVTGSPIWGMYNNYWHVVAVNQDDVIYIGDPERKVTCYDYSTECSAGDYDYYIESSEKQKERSRYGDYGGYGGGGGGNDYGGYDNYGGDDNCPPIVKCEFYASNVDTKLINWKGDGTGWAWGDPHFVTLDGATFNVYNNCQYYLMLGDNWNVQAQYFKRDWGQPQIKGVTVTYATNRVRISQNGAWKFFARKPWKQFKVSLPFTAKFLSITQTNDNPPTTFVQLANGVGVKFQAGINKARWDMVIPNTLKGELTGLLGNYNGDPKDDCKLPNGQTVACPPNGADPGNNAYLKGWEVAGTSCNPNDPKYDFVEDDGEISSNYAAAQAKCQIMNNAPFDACFNETYRAGMISACAFDYDESNTVEGAKISLCEALKVFATECSTVNQDIMNFRDDVPDCPPPTCPAGQIFNPCITPCDLNCAVYKKLTGVGQCGKACVGICACPEDQIFDENRKCIQKTSCTV